MKKPLRFLVVENVYRKHLVVLVDGDRERAAKTLPRLMEGADGTLDLGRALGRTYFCDGKSHLVVWLHRRDDLSTLVHELAHVCFYILETRGVTISHQEDEPFAYLLQFFMNRCLDELGLRRFSGAD